jgi:hypothetical protein
LVGFFLPPIAAPTAPKQQHRSAARRIHCQICKKKPEEPDMVEPELVRESDESLAMESCWWRQKKNQGLSSRNPKRHCLNQRTRWNPMESELS